MVRWWYAGLEEHHNSSVVGYVS
ncbi:hypothetical protein RSAG8_10738, partial [Rhizoctonia solani AG-8 WAC10335]